MPEQTANFELHLVVLDKPTDRRRWNGDAMASQEAEEALYAAVKAFQQVVRDHGFEIARTGYGATATDLEAEGTDSSSPCNGASVADQSTLASEASEPRPCPHCGGDGEQRDVVAGCCGAFRPDGQCCGTAVPVEEVGPCEGCNGSGVAGDASEARYCSGCGSTVLHDGGVENCPSVAPGQEDRRV